MRGSVVIGSAYGDEGKGNFTDYLCGRESGTVLNVRFNGGGQAAHTVVRDGRRHVFHHVGSGALAGAVTYLSRFFIANAWIYERELADLRRMGVEPAVLIDPDAMLTTPFDMLLNQYAERRRGSARHGSCGAGIGETVERITGAGRKNKHRTYVGHVLDGSLRDRLFAIRDEYCRTRAADLCIDLDSDDEIFFSDHLIENYVVSAERLFTRGKVVPWHEAAGHYDAYVFEGAQGLMLHQERKDLWPYVTWSRTGSENAVILATEADFDQLDVYYVTRAYATRHGAGPLPYESDVRPPFFEDPTNIENEFQGKLRVAPLNLAILKDAVDRDRDELGLFDGVVTTQMVVTCMDQISDEFYYVHDSYGRGRTFYGDQLPRMIESQVNIPVPLVSYGPSAINFKERVQ